MICIFEKHIIRLDFAVIIKIKCLTGSIRGFIFSTRKHIPNSY